MILTAIISFGILFAFALVALCLVKWWNVECVGVTPVPVFTFIAILFTSGLDVGLIMFPLTEFPVYADTVASPQYGFTNPLAIEFGFWAFLIWGFYFLTSFYFCIVEPRVKFFQLPVVKIVHNVVIIGTCAFTAALFLKFAPWYLQSIFGGDGETILPIFYLVVFVVIGLAVYSSTEIRFIRILSLASTYMFFALIVWMWVAGGIGIGQFASSVSNIGGYFANIHKFVLPIDDYHQFYLFWWFAWSIMIGQFTARFMGGLKTWQVFLALLVFPSIPIAVWFSVLYGYFDAGIQPGQISLILMAVVGVTFVINSFDSLIRLYTDNLGYTTAKLGKPIYIAGNLALLFALAVLFSFEFLKIEWIGAIVVGVYLAAVIYIAARKRSEVWKISGSPSENTLDFEKVKQVH